MLVSMSMRMHSSRNRLQSVKRGKWPINCKYSLKLNYVFKELIRLDWSISDLLNVNIPAQITPLPRPPTTVHYLAHGFVGLLGEEAEEKRKA